MLERRNTIIRALLRALPAAVLCLLCAVPCRAGQNRLTDIRHWTSPTFTRIVLDLEQETEWQTEELKDANRLAVRLDGFVGRLPKDLLEINDGIVRKVRLLHSGGSVRILIEFEKPAEHKIFALKKIDEKPPRLVIDVTRADLEQADRVQRQETRLKKKKGDYIVVVDPGHGGEDPGAVSPAGTYEKNLVLSIGRQVVEELSARPGIKAYLTRRGDYFIPLGKRVEIASEYGADLFLSVHVNAGFSKKAAGSSVYCLSFKGASSNVGRIAEQRENASDSIGGVPLDQQNSNVNVILCDLVQTHTINSSVQLAGLLLDDIGRFNRLYLPAPQEANFAVLRAPDIPSVLIETDFISTPAREKLLKKKDFQKRFAKTVADAAAAYLSGRQPRELRQAASGTEAPAGPAEKEQEKQEPARQAEPAKPALPPMPTAPEGGKYRVVRKSATEYALVPVADPAAPAPDKEQAAPKQKQRVKEKTAAKKRPAPAAPVTVVTTHVVKKGESLSLIAQKYGLSLKELCRQNNLPLNTKIAAGVKLKIVKQKSAQN